MSKATRALKWMAAGTAVLAVLGGGFVAAEAARFDASMDHVYDVAVPAVKRTEDPPTIARGEHLARSVAGCALDTCHGADLAGGQPLKMGPMGNFTGPNITEIVTTYSDGELSRLIRHGLRKDGRSLRFMPVQDFAWLPDEDVAAIVSWLRTVPKSPRPSADVHVGLMGKVADRRELIKIDVARRLAAAPQKTAADAPAPNADYGKNLAQLCTGCHGEHLSGGKMPAGPPAMPAPANLTPSADGLAGWTYDDFTRFADTGVDRAGRHVDAFMPTQAIANMNETERRALWAFLRGLPPRPFGQR